MVTNGERDFQSRGFTDGYQAGYISVQCLSTKKAHCMDERTMTPIEDLAQQQLDAYNRSDLDAFVACYHPDVRVFNGNEHSLSGIDAFRERYRTLFNEWQFGASVPQRMSLNTHCVDFETWWRVDPNTGERSEGTILVRYEECDGRIRTVQFLR